MVNGAVTYSNPCKAVKIIANTTVTINATDAWNFEPATIEWCAQVTDAPDDNNKQVFNSGTFHGSSVTI